MDGGIGIGVLRMIWMMGGCVGGVVTVHFVFVLYRDSHLSLVVYIS